MTRGPQTGRADHRHVRGGISGDGIIVGVMGRIVRETRAAITADNPTGSAIFARQGIGVLGIDSTTNETTLSIGNR